MGRRHSLPARVVGMTRHNMVGIARHRMIDLRAYRLCHTNYLVWMRQPDLTQFLSGPCRPNMLARNGLLNIG